MSAGVDGLSAPVAGADAEDRGRSRPRTHVAGWPWLVAWGGAVVAALWWLDGLGRTRTFFYDEWNFVVDRWRFGTSTFLAPHNGHLSIVPAGVFLGMFRTIGLDHYRAFRVAGLLVHTAVASAVLAYAWRRIGPAGAFGAGLIVLLLGSAWQNVMWPFQIGFMGSVLSFVLALMALDRRTTRGDVLASVAVAVGLGCSGVGLAAGAAVGLEVALTRPWRRWWIVLAPAAAYGIWYLAYGDSQSELSNLRRVPGYVFDSASAAAAGLFGWGMTSGRVLLVVLVAAAVVTVLVRRRVPVRVVTLAAAILAFWCMTAMSRGQYGTPDASRYVYVGVVVIVLLAAELVGSARVWAGLAVLAVGVLSAWATADVMRAGAGGLRLEGQLIGAELGVMERFRPADPAYAVDPSHAPGLTAGEYFAAVEGTGSSPAFPVDVIAEMPDFARAGADRVLLELAPPDVRSTPARGAGSCSALLGATADLAGAQVAPGSVVEVRSSDQAAITVGRWAMPVTEIAAVPAGTAATVTFPDDGVDVPWTLRLSGGAEACLLR